MIKICKKSLNFLVILAVLAQLIFLIFSGSYTTPRHDGKIYATTGIKFQNNDLAKLNEAAHYFGQTMVGWTKFPNFKYDLISYADLPEDTRINMHAQERQNFIFTVTTNKPVGFDSLQEVKNFLQSKIDEYNSNTNTQFVLTNVDIEQVESVKTYAFGALITLLLSVTAGLALLFIRNEFFPPKLKL